MGPQETDKLLQGTDNIIQKKHQLTEFENIVTNSKSNRGLISNYIYYITLYKMCVCVREREGERGGGGRQWCLGRSGNGPLALKTFQVVWQLRVNVLDKL